MNKWMPILVLLILIVAAGLRVPRLAERPMHHDEANQAYRFGQLLEEGSYEYDAGDHHGPTLYYLTLPIAWLSGAATFAETGETTYRTLPVLFGLLLILCTPLLRSGIGSLAVLTAALLTAISPGMAYYSRFYIQEMSLVFFTFLAIAAGWHSWHSGSRTWAVICGLSMGLMFSTKETAVIAYAAMLGSGLICAMVTRTFHRPQTNILIAVGSAVTLAFLLFSSFLTHPSGPLESIIAFKGYFARGSGIETAHVHPWYFYLKMLVYYRFEGGPIWSELLIFGLGICGAGFILLKRIPSCCNLGLARFLLFYTLLLTLAYSVLPYKTPWCILSFLHGWILLAGISIATAIESAKYSRMSGLAVLIFFSLGCVKLTTTAHRTVYRYAADHRNPYVYAHTSPDLLNLVRRVGELERVNLEGDQMYIQVVADPKRMWPLPFYLRGFPNTGYWVDSETVPVLPRPAIIISEPDNEIQGYRSEFYALRPDILLSFHIRDDLWERFSETRK